jgi:2-polyprenyl-6-methoxyphenol hydroxylase-like FAD-dependent oxidoreductase
MRALICGGGIAGLATAWWLDRIGWDVVIVEQAPRLRDEGYMIDFWDAGYDAAERMGLLPRLHDVAYDVDRVSYVDASGHEVSHIDYVLFSRMQHGRLLTLMRGDLEHALHDALGDRVDQRFATSIRRIDGGATSAVVTLTDGTTTAVDLVVGADGIHSHVRDLVFGPERDFLRDLGFHTAAHVFDDATLHDRLDGRFAMRSVPGRLVGCYPIRDHHVAAFYAFIAPQPGLPADPRGTLRDVYSDLGWVVPEMLAACPAPPQLYYDNVAQVTMPRWHRGRVVLVGDACQAVSLLAGQGASMAMAGAHALAIELAATVDVGAALTAYEHRVRPAIVKKQAAGRRTANWFVPDSQARIRARDVILRLSALHPLEWLLRPILTTPGGDIVGGADVRP